jgi:hypothetical protein
VYYNEELVKFQTQLSRNYLNDSEHVVKTKNAPFFMIFANISFFHMAVNYWTGPLSMYKHKDRYSTYHTGKHFSLRKWQIRTPHMFLLLEG